MVGMFSATAQSRVPVASVAPLDGLTILRQPYGWLLLVATSAGLALGPFASAPRSAGTLPVAYKNNLQHYW